MAKDITERQQRVFTNQAMENLKSLRGDGVIDRSTFRYMAKMNSLPCARQAITPKGGNRVPEMPKFVDYQGEETPQWSLVKSKPAVRFSK